MEINTVIYDKQARFGMKIILLTGGENAILFLRLFGFMLVADSYLLLLF